MRCDAGRCGEQLFSRCCGATRPANISSPPIGDRGRPASFMILFFVLHATNSVPEPPRGSISHPPAVCSFYYTRPPTCRLESVLTFPVLTQQQCPPPPPEIVGILAKTGICFLSPPSGHPSSFRPRTIALAPTVPTRCGLVQYKNTNTNAFFFFCGFAVQPWSKGSAIPPTPTHPPRTSSNLIKRPPSLPIPS